MHAACRGCGDRVRTAVDPPCDGTSCTEMPGAMTACRALSTTSSIRSQANLEMSGQNVATS